MAETERRQPGRPATSHQGPLQDAAHQSVAAQAPGRGRRSGVGGVDQRGLDAGQAPAAVPTARADATGALHAAQRRPPVGRRQEKSRNDLALLRPPPPRLAALLPPLVLLLARVPQVEKEGSVAPFSVRFELNQRAILQAIGDQRAFIRFFLKFLWTQGQAGRSQLEGRPAVQRLGLAERGAIAPLPFDQGAAGGATGTADRGGGGGGRGGGGGEAVARRPAPADTAGTGPPPVHRRRRRHCAGSRRR